MHKRKIVILGLMSKMPVAGMVYLTAQYLIGLKRLGYDVYYVEAHAGTPSMLYEKRTDDGSAKAAAFIANVMRRLDMPEQWAFHALHHDGACYGMTVGQLNQLYRSAELIINLHGGTKPLPEHYATGRLVYVGTDPVEVEIQLYHGEEHVIRYLEPHCAFFTWGENYGNPDCRVPYSERFHFIPTRQPIVLDWWQSEGGRAATEPGAFTTVGNWQQPWRVLTFQGETYYWSKHYEFLKIIDLPTRTDQVFELALSNCAPQDRALLESKRWRLCDGLSLSKDMETYHDYILGSRGEFTVAKDQNVRLRSGWFSDRSACYLAAGRPVITQDTGFGNILPTGRGLFGFSNMDEILSAVDQINSDYPAHSRAASEIAREYLAYDVVLPKLIEAIGAERADRPFHNAKARDGSTGLPDTPNTKPADSAKEKPFSVEIRADLPEVMGVDAWIQVECTVENLGSAAFASVPPNPVHLSYKWIDPQTGERLPETEGVRTLFPRALLPHERIQVSACVKAPMTAGRFELRLTVVQEYVAWFDDLDPRNVRSRTVLVVPREGVETLPAGEMCAAEEVA